MKRVNIELALSNFMRSILHIAAGYEGIGDSYTVRVPMEYIAPLLLLSHHLQRR